LDLLANHIHSIAYHGDHIRHIKNNKQQVLHHR
jgi:hypothetical protein